MRLAVLYGSMARGDEDADSDLDLLISVAGERPPANGDLAACLRHVTDRRIDIAHLARIEARAPLLLDCVLDEGRVLVDRDQQWKPLRARRRAIQARARRSHGRQMAAAARAIEELRQ